MKSIHKHYPQPVIVGTQVTGLLVSIALSRAQIAHVLIGAEPGDHLPRTGQILTPVGTPTFAEHFPELAHLAYRKKERVVHVGDYFMQLDFSNPTIAPFLAMVRTFGGPQFTYPWNLDRVAADKALFEKAIHTPFCRHVESIATAVEVDQAQDRLRSVSLADGTQILTSHLFDAMGHERFLARKLNLPCKSLGEPQSIVHAIYAPEAQAAHNETALSAVPTADWYQHRASVVRLYAGKDGMDGSAVCIPLGDHVSIHANYAAGSSELSQEELLNTVQRALKRYDIDYQAFFPVCTQVGTEIQEQYVHDRAYGSNWLLTGSAYCNTLVTIAANTDTYFAAFYTGPHFLRAPQTVGAIYQKYLDHFLIMQEVWHWGNTHNPECATKARIRHYLNRYVWANQAQYAQYLQLKYYDNPLRPAFGTISRIGDWEPFSQLSPAYASVNTNRG